MVIRGDVVVHDGLITRMTGAAPANATILRSYMKFFLLIVVTSLLTGCGAWDRIITRYTGSLTYKCSKDGIEYVQSDSGLALHVYADGKPKRCSE